MSTIKIAGVVSRRVSAVDGEASRSGREQQRRTRNGGLGHSAWLCQECLNCQPLHGKCTQMIASGFLLLEAQ